MAALAAAPLAVVLAAMALLHWPALWAGLAGLGVAAALAAFAFALPGGAGDAAGVAAEAFSTTATILWIILPALTLYELQTRAGAFERLRAGLTALSPDRGVQVLLIAWFFGLFMEGAAGFGTPVALAAPLLVGLGVVPVRAVALALLGHCAGVSFGAVGTPVLAQVAATGLDGVAIAGATALLHLAVAGLLAVLVMRLASEAPLDAAQVGLALLAAFAFTLPATALAVLAGPEVATLGGALIGGACFAALVRARAGRAAGAGAGDRTTDWRLADVLPYLLIVALVLASRLIGPLTEVLAAPRWGWTLAEGRFSGGIQPLYHPGSLLAAGLIVAALASGRGRLIGPALAAAAARLVPVAAALLAMLLLARLMVHAGMIDALAQGAAGAGALWPLLAPAIGVLGTFVTGSATASNILFTGFQVQTAQALGLGAVPMAAAQGFGAAIGNAVAPHNIIAGSATVGLAGREGAVLALTARPVALCTLAAGVLLLGWTAAGG